MQLRPFLVAVVVAWTVCALAMPAVAMYSKLATTLNFAGEPIGAQGNHRPANPALVWRNIGPAAFGVRPSMIDAPLIYKDGVSLTGRTIFLGGPFGVYKTDNAGITWRSVFDADAKTIAVNALAVSRSNPKIVWVGTSDNNIFRREVSGSGVYKSTDGGEHWMQMGLTDSVLIGRLAIDPQNPNIVYVAVMGDRWHPSQTRGIYKTADGGKTWRRTLFVNGWTAAVDVAVDPHNTQNVFAGTWQHAEAQGGLIDGVGEGSGIFRSTDGGETWQRLHGGLPGGKRGRTAVAVSPARDGRVYAQIYMGELGLNRGQDGRKVSGDTEKGYLYRSDDGGDHWTRGATVYIADQVMMGQLVADPKDADRVYTLHEGDLEVSNDGGKHLKTLKQQENDQSGGDEHALWINPDNPDDLWNGNDYGIWHSIDRGKSWHFFANEPGALYYTIAADRQKPFYNIYGNVQDHVGNGVPSRTRALYGIRESDWFNDNAPEGDAAAPDPFDPNSVYVTTYTYPEFSGIVLGRFDKPSGQTKIIAPAPELSGSDEVTSFTNPTDIVVSSHQRGVIYVGNRVIYRSGDGGQTWKSLTPDAGTAAPPISIMGINRKRTTVEVPVVQTIAESPLDARLLYYGTNLGKIYRSTDTGNSWTELHIPELHGLPEVSAIVPSIDSGAHAFVAVSGVNGGEFVPQVFETRDGGRSWSLRTNGLPPRAAVLSLAQHPRRASLLFAGTDEGVFVSKDSGVSWSPLREGMPHVRVTGLVVQPDQNDLVAGTWGRGIYVLDDLTPLEVDVPAADRNVPYVFAPRATMQFKRSGNFDDKQSSELAFPNPPFGVPINYFIPAPAAAHAASLQIETLNGAPLATLSRSGSAGLHRATWDLNTHVFMAKNQVLDVALPPGTYRVRVRAGRLSSRWQRFTVTADPLVQVTQREYEQQFAAEMRAARLQRQAYADLVALTALGKQLKNTPPSGLRAKYTSLLDVFQPQVDLLNSYYFRTGIVRHIAWIRIGIKNAAGAPTTTELVALDQTERQLTSIEAQIASLKSQIGLSPHGKRQR